MVMWDRGWDGSKELVPSPSELTEEVHSVHLVERAAANARVFSGCSLDSWHPLACRWRGFGSHYVPVSQQREVSLFQKTVTTTTAFLRRFWS
jgi:hypothetical protein